MLSFILHSGVALAQEKDTNGSCYTRWKDQCHDPAVRKQCPINCNTGENPLVDDSATSTGCHRYVIRPEDESYFELVQKFGCTINELARGQAIGSRIVYTDPSCETEYKKIHRIGAVHTTDATSEIDLNTLPLVLTPWQTVYFKGCQNVVQTKSNAKSVDRQVAPCMERNTDYLQGGSDIQNLPVPVEDEYECQQECVNLGDNCKFWTFRPICGNFKSQNKACCYLKTSTGERDVAAGYISGPKTCECLEKWIVYGIEDNKSFEADVESAKMCQEKCAAHAGCNFFTFILNAYGSPRKGTCYFKKTQEPGLRDGNVLATSGPKTCYEIPHITEAPTTTTETPTTQQTTSTTETPTTTTTTTTPPTEIGACMERDTDFFGSDIISLPIAVEDVFDCQRECVDDDECKFWTFQPNCWYFTSEDTKKACCYLKDDNAEQIHRSGLISGSKECSTIPPTTIPPTTTPPMEIGACMERDTDFFGSDIISLPIAVEDVFDCQRECVDDDECKFWTFQPNCWYFTSEDTKKACCYLKDDNVEQIHRSGLISGSKECSTIPPTTIPPTTTPPKKACHMRGQYQGKYRSVIERSVIEHVEV